MALIAPAPASAAVPTPAPAPGRAGSPAAMPAQGGAPAPARGPAKSAIGGMILLDEDGDGAPSRGDRPIVGVAVRIVGPGVSTATTSDGKGSFVFDGLPAGSYTVAIGLPGGLAPISGTSRTVTLDGAGSGRADFFVVRPDRAPTPTAAPPTPTPAPTAAPQPTGTPKPLPTPAPAPGSSGADAASPGGPPSGPPAAAAPLPPVASLQGPRYAPGRASASTIQAVRTDAALWLGVPFITQLDGSAYAEVNCGPASAAMVLAAFGIHTTPAHIRNYANAMSGMYGRDVGTSLDQLSRALVESGLEVTDLYSGDGYLRWSTTLLRDEVEAGHPVVTLVKYRALPGHVGARVNFDHYIVIAGLAGDDFIYNDASYTGDRGYGLLISPGDLERAWDYSSIPRHGMAVGLPATAAPPEPGEQLDLGEEFTEDLPEVEIGPGAELRRQGAFSALIFRRVLVDGVPDESASSDPAAELAQASLELGGFVGPDPEPAAIDPSAAPAQSAPPRPVARASLPLVSLPGVSGPLGWLAAGLLVAVFALSGRRMLREPLLLSTQALDGGDGLQEGEVVG